MAAGRDNRGLRIAVIGAGYFSQFHVEAWTGLDEVAEVALCDRDAARAQALAARSGVKAVFTDAERMLDDFAPGLVDIVTPPDTHLALVQLACKKHLPIVCQKALAPTLAEAEQIVACAERANLPLIVHENFRFSPWYREAKRLIDAGMLGQLHSVSFRLRPGDGQGPTASTTATASMITSAITRAAPWARCGSKAQPVYCASTGRRACGGSRITLARSSTPTTKARPLSPAAR